MKKKLILCLGMALIISGCGKNNNQNRSNEMVTGMPTTTVEQETVQETQNTDSDTESERNENSEPTKESEATSEPETADKTQTTDASAAPSIDPANISYAEEFKQQLDLMRNYYIYTDYKKIDFDALEKSTNHCLQKQMKVVTRWMT